MNITDLKSAIEAVGGIPEAARICGLSYVAVSKWVKQGYLPRTEYSGETKYAEILAAESNGAFSAETLRSIARPTKSVA